MLVLPAKHVESDLADEGLRNAHIDPVDLCEVDSADALQFPPKVKLRRMTARLPPPLRPGASLGRCCRGRGLGVAELGGEALQLVLHRVIAFGDPLLRGRGSQKLREEAFDVQSV